MVSKWKKFVKNQKKTEIKIKNLESKSDLEIRALVKEMNSWIDKIWALGVTIELFDPNSEEIIMDILNKYDKTNLSLNEFKILCSPNMLTNIQKEIIDLYEIILSKEFAKLKEHASKYFWIKNTWGYTTILDENFFKEKIARLKDERINFEKEKKRILEINKKVQEEKNLILKKHKKIPTKIKYTLEFFELLTSWREERKKYVQITNHHLNKLLEEVSKRTRIKKDLLLFMTTNEMTKAIPAGFFEELKKRSPGLKVITR